MPFHHKEGGKCAWNDAKSKKVCKCEFGWGGIFCDKQLCPIVPGQGVRGKYRGKCVANSSAVDKNATWTPASCVCKAGMESTVRRVVAPDTIVAAAVAASQDHVCNPGWGGVFCNKQVCPNNCTGPEFGTCGVVSLVDKRQVRQCVCKIAIKVKTVP